MTLELADGSEFFLCFDCIENLPDDTEPTESDVESLRERTEPDETDVAVWLAATEERGSNACVVSVSRPAPAV